MIVDTIKEELRCDTQFLSTMKSQDIIYHRYYISQILYITGYYISQDIICALCVMGLYIAPTEQYAGNRLSTLNAGN